MSEQLKPHRRVFRNDTTETIREVVPTPSGGRRVHANFSRVGVFNYRQDDGSVQREFRPPEEVLHPDSIASFGGAPVTVLHPPDMVDPTNWKEHSVGSVYNASAEAPFVSGYLDVNHYDAINRLDLPDDHPDRLQEISTGYDADIDPTPGIYNGQPYDVIQRRIRVNHVAMGPNGWGRQGSTVSLRSDSDSGTGSDMATEQTSKRQTKVDGIAYDHGSDSHVQALDREIEKRDVQIRDLTSRANTAEGRADAAEKRGDAKAIAKRVTARIGLIMRARDAMAYRARLDGKGKAAIAQAYRYLDSDDEAEATDDDAIILKTIQAMCPGFTGQGLNHDQLMGAMHGMSHMQAGSPAPAATEPDGDESIDEGEYDGGDVQEGMHPDENMPGVPSKDAGMVPQPAGNKPSTENSAPPDGSAMKPPPKAFDGRKDSDGWDPRFVPRGAFTRGDSRDAAGVPINQERRAGGGGGGESEAEARQRVAKRDSNAWKKGIGLG